MAKTKSNIPDLETCQKLKSGAIAKIYVSSPANRLNARFTAANKKPRHFIAWAADMGFKVEHATISRHEAGTQGITIPWGIAYECFFMECEKNIEK